MPLLNYTTEIQATKSISEIIHMLQDGGAAKIMIENGPDREIVAISFMLETSFGNMPFQLPANVASVILAINAQIKAETEAMRYRRMRKRRIPLNLLNNKAQCERIAWRIAKDWLEAQLALATVGSAKLEQIMLPFATVNGQSFYQKLVDRGSLALPAPTNEPKNVRDI